MLRFAILGVQIAAFRIHVFGLGEIVACQCRVERFGFAGRRDIRRLAFVGAGRFRFVAFEQRIAFEFLIDIVRQFEIGQLKQLDGLLQLRRHDQGLALA